MLLLFLSAFALADDTTAGGQMPDLDVQAWTPSVDSRNFLWSTEGSPTGPEGLTGRSLISITRRPLVYYPAPGGNLPDVVPLVSTIGQIDLIGAYRWRSLRAGAVLPLVYAAGDGTNGEAGLGDPTLDFRFGILDRATDALGLAASTRITLPIATTELPVGAPGPTWDIEVNLDRDLGPFIVVLNAGTKLQPATSLENVEWGSQGVLRGGAALPLSDGESGIAGEVIAAWSWRDPGNGAAWPIEAMVQGWQTFGDSGVTLRFGVGTGLTTALTAPTARFVAGVSYAPTPAPDADNDGIADASDACIDKAEDLDGFEDADGCPEPVQLTVKLVDEQGQPIANATWLIGEQEGASGAGIATEPGVVTVQAKAEGYEATSQDVNVPTGAPFEAVVTLQKEKPPEVPTIATTATARGPEGEAITDGTWSVEGVGRAPLGASIDLPYGEHEVLVEATGYRIARTKTTVTEDGATDLSLDLVKAKVTITKSRVEIKDKVFFETNKAVIKPESFELLNEVAELIVAHPELTKIRIEGHTDSVGNASSNLDLSNRRAKSVLDYLVNQGVDVSRLESQGYGEEKPLVEEKTAEDRANNRRVEFFVVERSDGPVEPNTNPSNDGGQ